MPRKSRTKLLQLVCRRVALIRARFGHPSSSNTIKEDGKKSSFDRTGERFRLKLAKLNVGTSWPLIKKVDVLEEFISQQISISEIRNGILSRKSN